LVSSHNKEEITLPKKANEKELMKALCKCKICPFFGICPNFDYKLTKIDLKYLRKFYNVE